MLILLIITLTNNMFIITYRKIFYALSGILLATSLAFLISFGLRFGIEFTGGSILELDYAGGRPEKALLDEKLANTDLGAYVLRQTNESGYILETKILENATKDQIVKDLTLDAANPPSVVRFNTIGPTLGDELRSKSLVSVIVVILATILFLAYAFRNVAYPVTSWMYGLTAIVSMIHDVLLTLGVFSFLGWKYGVEVDTLFITALLVTLGYSINDSIVVLDRVRENIQNKSDEVRRKTFIQIVGKSLMETFSRSLNTSLTVIFALVALLLVGGASTYYFSLALMVGVVSGTYSSLFIAAPLLVSYFLYTEKKRK